MTAVLPPQASCTVAVIGLCYVVVALAVAFTSDDTALAAADVYVVTVPTPIDSAKQPDLTP